MSVLSAPFLAFYGLLLLGSIVVIVLSWVRSSRCDYRSDPPSAWLTVFGIIFTIIAPLIGFIRFDNYPPEIPFAKAHVASVEIMVIISALSYWLSRFYKREIPEWLNFFVRAGMMQGVTLCAFVAVHFGGYLVQGFLLPTFGFELDAPLIVIPLLLYELRCNYALDELNGYTAQVQRNRALQPGLLVVLLIVEQASLLPFGYSWNSLALAFTQSNGFTFSDTYHYCATPFP